MLSENNLTEGVFGTRLVLSDVTNRSAKRPFSSISSDSTHKSGVENSVKKKFILQFGSNTPQNDNDKMPGNHHSHKLPFHCATPLQNLSNSDLPPRSATEEENLLDGRPLGLGENAQRERITCGLSKSVQSDKDGVAGGLAPSKRGAVELPTIPGSRDFGFQGLERCSALKGFSNANPAVSSSDLLKYCTCSFCSKAAYIWTDLHYQDVKGRLGALKKSQKEASTMLQKFNVLKDKLIHDPQSNDESSKLELSLMEQWKSLFVHMEDTFAREGKQLESSFGALKDLRGSCKNDLELTENSHV